jgi:hypothetical protein
VVGSEVNKITFSADLVSLDWEGAKRSGMFAFMHNSGELTSHYDVRCCFRNFTTFYRKEVVSGMIKDSAGISAPI